MQSNIKNDTVTYLIYLYNIYITDFVAASFSNFTTNVIFVYVLYFLVHS